MKQLLTYADFIGLMVYSSRYIHAQMGYNWIISIAASFVVAIIVFLISSSDNKFVSGLGWLVFDAVSLVFLTRVFALGISMIPFPQNSVVNTVLALIAALAVVYAFEKIWIQAAPSSSTIKNNKAKAGAGGYQQDVVQRLYAEVNGMHASTERYIHDNWDKIPDAEGILTDYMTQYGYIVQENDKFQNLVSQDKPNEDEINGSYQKMIFLYNQFIAMNDKLRERIEYYGDGRNESKQKMTVPNAEISGNSFFHGCTDEDSIKARYRSLCKIYHPDNGNGDEETFKMINEEYGKLINP